MALIRFLLFLLLSTFVYSVALAEKVAIEEKVQSVDYVDNQLGLVVIGDMEYKLKLGTKVTDDSGRKLNRYALTPGQSVVVDAYYEKSRAYLDSVIILTKK